MAEVVKIEDLGKMYRLGEVGTGTLSLDIARVWARILGKPDPMLKIGQANVREQRGAEFVWALKGIDLTIQAGEVFGIIGRNGAGKSTLLKLLSRVTGPTVGRIRAKGRIAALLEVGTGFHLDLTGRENVYLNGAILGMRRWEVSKQLDSIAEFSGCSNYLDTPVKRYSSGMLVRLGFAVAAHLECEILIVDEVLAVGDAEFQRRCIGKMKEISQGGDRTLIFVSHNMASVASLCSSALVLENGQMVDSGSTGAMISNYLQSMKDEVPKDVGDSRARLQRFWAQDSSGAEKTEFVLSEDFEVCMQYEVFDSGHDRPYPNFHFYTQNGECAFISVSSFEQSSPSSGIFVAKCKIPAHMLNDGIYYVGFGLTFTVPDIHVSFFLKDAMCLKLVEPMGDEELMRMRGRYNVRMPGVMRPRLEWNVEKVAE